MKLQLRNFRVASVKLFRCKTKLQLCPLLSLLSRSHWYTRVGMHTGKNLSWLMQILSSIWSLVFEWKNNMTQLFHFSVSLPVPPKVRIDPHLASGHHPGHLQMQGSLFFNRKQRLHFLLQRCAGSAGGKAEVINLDWRCFEEDTNDIVLQVFQDFTQSTLPALHWQWQTPESIGRYCYLPPLVMASPWCRPHSLVAFPLHPDISRRAHAWDVYWGFCFSTDHVLVEFGSNSDSHEFCEPCQVPGYDSKAVHLGTVCSRHPLKLHLINHWEGWSVYLIPYLALAPG